VTPTSNLPEPASSFIGRIRHLAESRAALGSSRLLTLAGPGGVGKTRLALELARSQVGLRADGVWLADLATIAEPAAVIAEAASAIGMDPQRAPVTLEAVRDYVGDRDLLLMLDNCEQVIEACARLATELLTGCPRCRVLVTSREPLRIAGETVWRVPPLDPDDAVRLFIERTKRRRGDFQPVDAEDPAIRQLCARLDHLPLAIELAAARITRMTTAEMLERVEGTLALLTRGDRLSLPRHQTMRATIEWSYGLLHADEQRLLRRLAVFVRGFDIAAAIAVAQDSGLDELESLVDKSLVTAELTPSAVTRYQLLETVREFALEQLAAAGEVAAMRERHLQHFVARAEPALQQWLAIGSDAPVHQLDADYDNLRAALEWSVDADPRAGLHLVAATRDLWMRMGQSEGWRLASRLLERSTAPNRDRAGALVAAGHLALTHMRHDEARSLLAEARGLSAKLGDERLNAWATHYEGLSNTLDERADRALELLQAGRALFRRLGMRVGEARALTILGITLLVSKDPTAARTLLEEALAVNKDAADEWGEAVCLTYLGLIAAGAGDGGGASRHFHRAVDLFRPFNDGVVMPIALVGQAAVLSRADPERAVRVAAAASTLRTNVGGDFPRFVLMRIDEIRKAARASIGEVADRAWSEGSRLHLEDVMPIAFGRTRARRVMPGGLSKRELEVARLVAGGLTNKAIASRLHLSVRTIESHVLNASIKLGVDNRIQLATWAERLTQ
jgi:predicted ATPase/DNA-binding CsgD family transcriptional regulator